MDDTTQGRDDVNGDGMRGSGKSAVGPLLAERLGRHFNDTDEMVEERLGDLVGDRDLARYIL